MELAEVGTVSVPSPAPSRIISERDEHANRANVLCQAALHYASLGWYVIPIAAGTNEPHLEGWGQLATTDPEKIVRWWRQMPDANVGIVLGPSHLIVVDVDRHNEDGMETWTKIVENMDPSTVAVPMERTPRNGFHYYFAAGDTILPKNKMSLGPGIDVFSGEGRCVAVTPSRRPDGEYVWVTEPGLQLQEFPEELVRLTIERSETPRLRDHSSESKAIPEGERNCALTSVAGSLRRRGLGGESIASVLESVNAQVCDPPLPTNEVTSIAYSVAKYAPAVTVHDDPAPLRIPVTVLTSAHRTDAGAAALLRFLFRDKLRYDFQAHSWYIFDGNIWRRDPGGTAESLANQLAPAILWASAQIESKEARDEATRWGLSLESRVRRDAALQMARSLDGFMFDYTQWDPDKYLLGCTNGIVDLRTKMLRPGTPEDYVTMSTGIAYDDAADCPRWRRFVDEICGGNTDTAAYLQRAVGYSLTGDTSEQCLFFLHGSGANGKSTMLNAIGTMMGDYGYNTPFQTFELRQGTASTNDVAALKGKRWVTSSETSEERRLDEARVKAITGGDTMTARYLYAEYFRFQPACKIWLSANELPRITGTDEGIWRRMRTIPFLQSFAGKEDHNLENELKSETPGILNWALEGLAKWQASGLGTAPEVSAATAAYRSTSDVVRQFLDECTAPSDKDWTQASALYSRLSLRCKGRSIPTPSENSVSRRMTALGHTPVRTAQCRGYRGLHLIS